MANKTKSSFDKKRVASMLNEVISASLYYPSADPDSNQCLAAGECLKAMKLLGIKPNKEKDIVETLKVYGEEFEGDENFYLN